MRTASIVSASALVSSVLAGCAGRPSQLPVGADWRQYVVERPGASGPGAFEWRPDVCARVDLRADYRTLDETSLLAFLKAQKLDAHAERQPVEPNRPPLVFVFVTPPRGGASSVPLRVAILPSADEAGRALYEALSERSGTWGVHRGNLAVLGPPGAVKDEVAFGGATKLGCWGTFTFADSSNVFVVPGGYTEP